MCESELHSHIFRESRDLSKLFPRVLLGPGDDCAALRVGGETLLATVDHLIEHRHFAPDTPVDAVARKAIARSISDIAAMAGTPLATLATAALPHGHPQSEAETLYDRLAHWAKHFQCPLVGGDAATFGEGGAAGPLCITVTALGLAHPVRGPVTRAGAKAGDSIFVTGKLGGSLASGRHLAFEPRVREAQWLAETLGSGLHAMMDISDGLGRDAGRMASAFSVRIEIDARLLPLHSGVDVLRGVGEGEDYELLFAAPQASIPEIPSGTRVTRVGTVSAGSGCVLRLTEGEEIDASGLGWEHG